MEEKYPSISFLGDTGIIINFENKIDETINRKVLQLFHKIKNLSLPFVKDVVPAYCSITVFYDLLIMNKDPMATVEKVLIEKIIGLLKKDHTSNVLINRKIKIPVCYAEKYGWDINEIAKEKNISQKKIIDLHTCTKYRVYMTGFLPGFAYMGKVNEKISMPRKAHPRNDVAAGSVGIAGDQTGIYPLNSPGGWQIIGRTPLQLFDTKKNELVLLQPGDEVEFYSITEDEFANY